MISSAPGTAIEFFRAITHHKKYDLSLGQFSVNISLEALSNPDSSLYHEDDGFKSGLFGYIKPFSQAIYGNYALVETLARRHCSPLHLPDTFTSDWSAKQLEAYCRCTLITIENYLKNCNHNTHSFSITHAIDTIKNSCGELYKINEEIDNYYNLDSYKRLHEITRFTKNTIETIEKHWPQHLPSFKTTNKFNQNIYDAIANLMFDIIFFASHVTTPPDKCWSVQYASVWSKFFCSFDESKTLKIINHKLRRLLLNSIMEMSQYPNYKSARILGICLNIMGLTTTKEALTKKYYSLHKIIIKWVIKNFRNIAIEYPDIANTCLQGNISYDKEHNQLISTHIRGMKRELRKTTLQLD